MSEDDSTDWLNTTAPFLDKFEDNLRCPICRELLIRAPSITECGHTFCGECIMRHFNSSEKCPVCRTSIQRGKLRKNKAIGDLADIWLSQRQALMDIAQPVEKIQELPSISPEKHKSKQSSKQSELPSSEVAEISDSEDEALAQCPVCEKFMPIDEIQTTHITKCLNERPNNGTPTSSSPPPPKRQKRAVFGQEYPETKLAVPHFHSMNDTKLKAKAKEIGLSVKGSRQRIIARYMEWITVWNASVGDKHPRTIAELRKHIIGWDKTQDQISEGTPSLKSLDAQQYTQQNSSSFADLIAQAKTSAKQLQHNE